MSLSEVLRRVDWVQNAHDDEEAFRSQSRWLEARIKVLTTSLEDRIDFFNGAGEGDVRVVAQFWFAVTSEGRLGAGDRDDRLHFAVLLTRLFRNAVAGNEVGQTAVFPLVPHALDILRRTTSFAAVESGDVWPLTRALVQLLSNLITENSALQVQFWHDHIDETGVDLSLLCRLLRSSDMATRAAAQVLFINLTLSKLDRMSFLCSSEKGADIMSSVLDAVKTDIDAEIAEEEAEEAETARGDCDSALGMVLQPSIQVIQLRRQRTESLGLSFTLIQKLLECGFFDQLYRSLATSSDIAVLQKSNIDASVVTSAQLSLLKILDAYLNRKTDIDNKEADNEDNNHQQRLFVSVPHIFEHVAQWTTKTIRQALDERNQTTTIDGRLIEVHTALILLSQSLTSFALIAEKWPKASQERYEADLVLAEMRSDKFIDALIELIRSVARFSPPVSPFKGPVHAGPSLHKSAPEGHSLSSTGKARLQEERSGAPVPRLDNLKRDLVGLLGALTFKRQEGDDHEAVRKAQDRVREQGGLLEVLNLTQLDERNPYIRERAIFALKNLLLANQASQDLISQLKPVDPTNSAM